jgi:hypothetical protein
MNGWIAQIGASDYSHSFGGQGWTVRDSQQIADGPSLMLDLDLSDPKFSELLVDGLDRLPICSYINCDLWIEPQHYQISPEHSNVTLIQRSTKYTTILDEGLRFPNPLPKKQLSLREMTEEEKPINKGDYDRAVDSFVGGESFIRVLGSPLWLQQPESSRCLCGQEQRYVCSIGYENMTSSSFLDNRPFFIGEAALYFFLCSKCLILTVLSQPT